MIQNGSEQIFVQYLPNERQLSVMTDEWTKLLKLNYYLLLLLNKQHNRRCAQK